MLNLMMVLTRRYILMENEDMDLCTMVAKTLDDYGILYGDLVDNDDGTCNIVGVDESEWEDVRDAIEDGLGLTVDVPDEDHEEFDDELVVHGREQLGEGTSNEKDTYIVTMTGVSKKDEEELGIVGIRVSYEIPAGSEKEAKQIAKRFDPGKRIVSVELKESLKEENDKTKYFMLDIYGGYNKQELMASDIEVYAKTEKDAMKQAIKIFKDEYDYDPEENKFGLKAVITSSDLDEEIDTKELDETLPETFEGKIDFLAADEEEAIEGYDRVLLALDGDEYSNVRKQLEIIRDEEVAHKEFLEKVKSDLGTVYVDPNEDKEEEIVDIDTETDESLKESTKEEEETKSLEKMLDDDKYSLEDCMDAYLQEYEDTDIMHYSVLERTAYELEKDGDSEQSKRLLKLLDTNPGVTYFDYYEEEPITSKEWIKKRLAIDESKTKENIKESTKLAEYDIKKDAKPYKTCKGMEYYITPTGDSFTVVTKKENGEFGLGSASGLEFKSKEEAGKWVDHACSLKEGAVSDDTIRKIQDSDAYYMFADDDGDDFLIVDSWDDVHKIQKALEPGFEPRNDYDSSVLDKYFPGSTWGFSDSYDTCSKCGKLIRTEPDSYSWEPDFFVNDGELVCGDDVRDDPDAYLETLYNNPKMANTILTDSDLRNLGFELIKDGYESGMYDRHDDPEDILEKAKKEHPGMTFVFSISSNGQFATRFELWGKEDTDVHESINEGVAVDDPMLRRGISYLDLHRDHFGFLCSYLNRRLHKRIPVGKGFKTEAELLDFVRDLEAQDTGNVDFSVIRQGEQGKYLDALKDDATNLESPKDESYRDSDLIEFEDDMPMTYGQIVEMMDRGIALDLPAGTDREAIARQYANDYIIERDGHKSYRRALK